MRKLLTRRVIVAIFMVITVFQSAQAVTDKTSLIQNPSFENGTTGWTVSNMQTQGNSVFQKTGTYYLETWVSIGSKIADSYAVQTLKNLPQGNYQLSAKALHIQQTGSGSTTNKGTAQTGAWLIAGNAKIAVTSMKDYILKFSVVDVMSDVEIGLRAENATGNYLCVDNFRLIYIGELTTADIVKNLQQQVTAARELLEKGVQETVAAQLTAAIEQAEEAIKGTGTDEQGNTIYDEDAIKTSQSNLNTAMTAARNSRAIYDALLERIEYAEKVYGWWEGTEKKQTMLEKLSAAIESAKQKVTDYSLPKTHITVTTSTLNGLIANVDKKIYCSGNACGTDDQLKVSTSQWCYDRSMQSKHWILFWEAGYGTAVPSAVPGILSNADKIFELYADSLKYITINQGKSKTDTYKMIIRLRYTTDWEASGSGIDDQIGLLTLSNGAHTSRNGQTVAHEIGHCFQYQTHCDNNNRNGWMYNWGKSTYNVFWEMCAQWQAYKFYPKMQFNNEWLDNTLNGLHRHPLAVHLRYNNYFIQDYFCHKHGMDFMGVMWNKSEAPEDPLQAYMRLTMTGTAAEKLDKLNDEMWEYGARMTSFDMDPIRSYGTSTIGQRKQTSLIKDSEGFFMPKTSDCIENFGNNAISLNLPSEAKTVYAELIGEAGKTGYITYNVEKAGWKYGFVALQRDGTRVYGDIATATYDNPSGVVEFQYPGNCSNLWFVVSGAPTAYWTRDWISWDEEGQTEQWPYRVKFYQTNVKGNANNNTYPTTITHHPSPTTSPLSPLTGVYSLSGQLLRRGSTSLEGLPSGVYIVNGKKVVKN